MPIQGLIVFHRYENLSITFELSNFLKMSLALSEISLSIINS